MKVVWEYRPAKGVATLYARSAPRSAGASSPSASRKPPERTPMETPETKYLRELAARLGGEDRAQLNIAIDRLVTAEAEVRDLREQLDLLRRAVAQAGPRPPQGRPS